MKAFPSTIYHFSLTAFLLFTPEGVKQSLSRENGVIEIVCVRVLDLTGFYSSYKQKPVEV